MNGVAVAFFVAAHVLSVMGIVAVGVIERRRREFHIAANFRDGLNLVAMAALGSALLVGGMRPPAAFLIGFYHWLVLYGVSRLSLRAAWAASIVFPIPTLAFQSSIESAVTNVLAAASS